MADLPLTRIAGGAFCDVFDLGDGRVLKAFTEVPLEVAPAADPSLAPRIAFSAERQFYLKLQDHPDLEIYCPGFMGEADPSVLPLESAKSYPAGCGLVLEKIPGEALKMFELPERLRTEVEGVVEQMTRRIGLDDPWDGSCFVPGTRAAFTLIDLATPTSRLVALDNILVAHGHVPDHLHKRLGL